ncbi:5-formyltetrahydrofolate cyclo-ligase [Pseudocercospora fuligena]|uniref:5-formyltetrahydrofolate cyclo-ligase n=1 Tax=Pseudocercospora fuligena TaxID=685502 RepID=A0A8H6RV40_9PEZI|nr:5-formyltetrahydrofolate cyclo-ligase [Pseudocercospora fuligena]
MATDAKKALRSEIKQKLPALSEQDVLAQSRKAQNVILGLPEYRKAKRVGIYLSMPKSEAQTSGLVPDALWTGKEVFVPYIYSVGTEKPKTKVMDMLRLSGLEDYGQLESDSWGIPTLPKEGLDERQNAMGFKGRSMAEDGVQKEFDSQSSGGLDLIVVPGVAFDPEMNRMGHGAGFYDKFLTRFTEDGKNKKPYLVGLCLAEQILPTGKLVMQEWDWKVDAVACGDGTLLTPNTQ